MQNFKTEIAKACFLFEAIDYLLVGYPPMEDLQYGDYNARYSYDLYREGIESFPQDEAFVMDLFHRQYTIIDYPYDDPQYEEINHHSSYEEFETFYGHFGLNSDNQDLLLDIQRKRELLKDFLPKRKKYEDKIAKIITPFEKELIQALYSGSVSATGLLIEKYDSNQNCFIEIDEEWYHKAIRREIGYKTLQYLEPKYYEDEKCERVSIPKEYWIYENINFDTSSLEFKIGNDRYKYCFVMISFQDLYKAKPQQLEYEIVAKLVGNRIIYNEKTYHEITENSTKGRKSLEWDLFYAELFRYLIEYEKGILPKKQDVLITHMKNWCENTGFSNGSRGSIQPKISAIYNAFEKVKK